MIDIEEILGLEEVIIFFGLITGIAFKYFIIRDTLKTLNDWHIPLRIWTILFGYVWSIVTNNVITRCVSNILNKTFEVTVDYDTILFLISILFGFCGIEGVIWVFSKFETIGKNKVLATEEKSKTESIDIEKLAELIKKKDAS